MLLTVNQLEQISPYTGFKRIELILPNLNNTLKKYDINTEKRIAHFLSQLVVESNYFRYIQDFGSGAELENSVTLGNTQKGDGRRFIGRGYFKLVGRNAYQEYKKSSGIDVISYPHYVTTPKVAMDIAGWIWHTKQLNILADQDSLEDITKLLTGGYTFLRERQDILAKAEKELILDH